MIVVFVSPQSVWRVSSRNSVWISSWTSLHSHGRCSDERPKRWLFAIVACKTKICLIFYIPIWFERCTVHWNDYWSIYILLFYPYRFRISAARLQLHSGKQGTINHWTAVNEQIYLAAKSNGKPWSNWTRERVSVFLFTDINGGHCYYVLCNYIHIKKYNSYQKKGCTAW